MSPRGMLVAFLFVLELAVVGEMVVAIQGGGHSASWPGLRSVAEASSGSKLADGGEHKTFDVGDHPALTVDIGYADLTIVTRKISQIDVSVSKSSDFGIFRAKAPITAEDDGATIRVGTAYDTGISTGDMRMVTVIVPPETSVTVVTAGDIRANGLRADATFHSKGDGSVTIGDFAGPSLSIKSSGKVSLEQIVATHLDATSDDDRIEGSGIQVHDGSVDGNDSVSLGFASGADTIVNADSNDGKVNVAGFPAGAATNTGHKGDDDDSSSQTVRVGAGGGNLDVHSDDGNITLTQES